MAKPDEREREQREDQEIPEEFKSPRMPPGERIYLDHFILQLPVPIHYTFHWKFICQQRGSCCCGCCCGCSADRAGHEAPVPQPAPARTPAAAPVPVPVQLQVELDPPQFRYMFVGGPGQLFGEFRFQWRATGAPNLRVSLQVKSATYDWSPVPGLQGRSPIDVGVWSFMPLHGQTLWFRAVARDNGNVGYSQIQQFQ